MTGPSHTKWVLITLLVGVVMFFTGVIATAVLMRSSLVSVTASPQPTATSAVPPVEPTPVPQAARPQLGWVVPGVRVAPRGDVMSLEDGVVQRTDGVVFVHAGRGTLTAFPASMGGEYKFGFRPAPGTRSPEAVVSSALVNADVRNRVELTADQRQQLDAIGPIPQPNPETQDAIITLFETYANADGDAKIAAEKVLLDAVRRDGESRAESIEPWHVKRYAVLTDAQCAAAVPTSRRPTITTLPAVEQ